MASSQSNSGKNPANRRKHSIALGIVLFVIWLLWSGHYTPMLVGFGIFSCLFVLFLSRRMNIADEEGAPFQLGVRPFIYSGWLIKEIVLANIDVARLILNPKLPISPKMIRVKASQNGDLTRVIYANSITLTPGTVSVDAQGDEIEVHALTRESAAGVESGEMDRRVKKLEGST